MSEEKESVFAALTARVMSCRRCPRMANSARVLGHGCGSLDAPLMFVGEAPGRLGADASELPFHGDRAGNNFEALLEQVGLSRYDVFVTNSVLCNPKDEHGNNATPNTDEITNCAHFLREQLDLIGPKIVVPLGAVALRSCSLVDSHHLTLRENVRTAHSWNGRQLIPLYHPGQRAMVHRSFANQLADYQFVAETTRRVSKPRKRSNSGRKTSRKVAAVVARLLENRNQLSYFALHKLLFLAEVRQLEESGGRLTGGYFVRQKDGPYCVELHSTKLSTLLPGVTLIRSGARLLVRHESQPDLLAAQSDTPELTSVESAIVDKVAEKYGAMSDADLKRAVYLTSHMRQILRKEKSQRMNMFNSPVLPP